MNQEAWDELKEQIKSRQEVRNKRPLANKIRKIVLVFSLIIVPLIPLVVTENFVIHSMLCQWFISVMSSWIPGIAVISHASAIPNITALTVSFAWVAIGFLFVVLLQFLLELGAKNYFLFFAKSTKLMILLLMFMTLALVNEFNSSSHTSFLYGTTALYDPHSRHNFFYMMIQSKIGVGLFIFSKIFWLTSILLGWIMASLEIFGKLIKGVKDE